MTIGSALMRGYSRERAIARAPRKPKKKKRAGLTPTEISKLKAMARGGY